jgi:hypothetical protein
MTYRFYKKQRLPRKLKKAARHVDFNVCDMQQMTDVSTDPNNVVMKLDVDYRVVMHPVGYPKTRSVRRLIALWRRKIGQAHRQAVRDMLRRQYLEQHPGVLTYKDNPHPAPPKNEHPGYMVMTKEQMQRIADRMKPDLLSPSPEAVAMVERGDVQITTCHDCPHWQDGDDAAIKVVGNRYDNPELIKVRKV